MQDFVGTLYILLCGLWIVDGDIIEGKRGVSVCLLYKSSECNLAFLMDEDQFFPELQKNKTRGVTIHSLGIYTVNG